MPELGVTTVFLIPNGSIVPTSTPWFWGLCTTQPHLHANLSSLFPLPAFTEVYQVVPTLSPRALLTLYLRSSFIISLTCKALSSLSLVCSNHTWDMSSSAIFFKNLPWTLPLPSLTPFSSGSPDKPHVLGSPISSLRRASYVPCVLVLPLSRDPQRPESKHHDLLVLRSQVKTPGSWVECK